MSNFGSNQCNFHPIDSGSPCTLPPLYNVKKPTLITNPNQYIPLTFSHH